LANINRKPEKAVASNRNDLPVALSRNLVRAIHLDPTFPIDEARIRARYRRQLSQAPYLYGWLVIGKLAHWFQRFESEVTQRFCRWGSERWSLVHQSLMLRSIRELASESNVQQDEAILRMMSQLSEAAQPQYAICLGKFLLLKQDIERELHRDSAIDERRKHLENLVDSVCNEVCRDIFRLSKANDALAEVLTTGSANDLDSHSKQLNEGHARISHAYGTLSDIASQLAILLNPGAEPSGSEETKVLDQLLEILKSETRVAKIVDERIRNELPNLPP
jgi:hypothetical protein